MKRPLLAPLALAVLLAVPATAAAAPLDTRLIPAEAQGVGHLDVDAARVTSLYKALRARVDKKAMADLDPKLRQLVDMASVGGRPGAP